MISLTGSRTEGPDHHAVTFTTVLEILKYLSDSPRLEWL